MNLTFKNVFLGLVVLAAARYTVVEVIKATRGISNQYDNKKNLEEK
jgi:hypothetical protein